MDAPDPGRRVARPFLVARGFSVAEQVVLAPAELAELPRRAALLDLYAPSPDGGYTSRAVPGPWVAVFRTVPVDSPMPGASTGASLVDRGGRTVEITEGVLVAADDVALLGQDVLDAAHDLTLRTFFAFWLSDSRTGLPHVAEELRWTPADPATQDAPRIVPAAPTRTPTGSERTAAADAEPARVTGGAGPRAGCLTLVLVILLAIAALAAWAGP